MFIEDLSMDEFRESVERGRTLVIPYGTVEAHGVHLPLGTDTMIVMAVLEEVANRLDIMVAPPLNYGVCTSTSMHSGTIGITPSTLRSLTTDIVRHAYEQGVREFILLSGHGGGLHLSAMREASEELVRELEGIKIAALTLYEILPEETRAIIETPADSHAGELETSLILYLSEHLVKGGAKEEYPKLPKPIVVRNKPRYWRGAVWGNPEKATKEKGQKVYRVMVSSVEEFIKRFQAFTE